jgi:hypothetical protein
MVSNRLRDVMVACGGPRGVRPSREEEKRRCDRSWKMLWLQLLLLQGAPECHDLAWSLVPRAHRFGGAAHRHVILDSVQVQKMALFRRSIGLDLDSRWSRVWLRPQLLCRLTAALQLLLALTG